MPVASLWRAGLTAQIFLGDAQFAARMQTRALDIPRAQRLPALSWSQCLDRCGGDRARALRMAHAEGGLSVSALAREIGLSVFRVSRIIARVAAATVLEGAKDKT